MGPGFLSSTVTNSVCDCRYEQLGSVSSPERVEQYRRTLRQALHVWLDQFPEDYREPPNFPCLSHLENFCRRIMPGSELDNKVQRKAPIIRKESAMKNSSLIQQLLDSSRPSPNRYSSRSHSLPSFSFPPYTDILDIPTKHFAHQITAMDNVSNSQIFRLYHPPRPLFGLNSALKGHQVLKSP